jgi:predicted short-subunit dehydrogenase-like oxidoreductase (DUF2520 family)
MKPIQRISIIGYGNVGKALCTYFLSRGVEVVEVLVRRLPLEANLPSMVRVCSDFSTIQPVDMVLVCVTDSAVSSVVDAIPINQFVAYTSGSIALNDLKRTDNIGVFYPLQTFRGEVVEDMFNVPILLESENQLALEAMRSFAVAHFKRVQEMQSTDRENLHLAAVFVNNFTNHLYHIAETYLEKNNLDFELLLPLIKETVRKLSTNTPFDAQTGPARRGDEVVLEKHYAKLSGFDRELYQLLSESIKKTYANKNTN